FQLKAPHLVFARQPASVTVGSAITPSVQVQVKDAFGNTPGSDVSTITVTASGGTGTLGGTLTGSWANTIATFSNLTESKAGTYTLTAHYGPNSAIVASSTSFTVNPANTTTAIVSSNAAINVGQSVTFTATLTPASGS